MSEEYCTYCSNKVNAREIITKQAKDISWLKACLKNFYPFNGDLPSGLHPTAYQTLSYEGDKELLDKFNLITEDQDDKAN